MYVLRRGATRGHCLFYARYASYALFRLKQTGRRSSDNNDVNKNGQNSMNCFVRFKVDNCFFTFYNQALN